MPYRATWARRSFAPTLAFTIRRTDATPSRPTPLHFWPTIQQINSCGIFQVPGLGHRVPGSGPQVQVQVRGS